MENRVTEETVEASRSFELATTYYKNFREEMGEPVRISNGGPRWKTPYTIRFMLSDLFPDWGWMKLPVPEFRRRYWVELDMLGVEEISRQFERVVWAAGQKKLVLMCFEKNVDDCHRGDFAMWWKRETGEQVPEL